MTTSKTTRPKCCSPVTRPTTFYAKITRETATRNSQRPESVPTLLLCQAKFKRAIHYCSSRAGLPDWPTALPARCGSPTILLCGDRSKVSHLSDRSDLKANCPQQITELPAAHETGLNVNQGECRAVVQRTAHAHRDQPCGNTAHSKRHPAALQDRILFLSDISRMHPHRRREK